MKKRLIINADDFGYSRGVNYGILDAHRLGCLTSTTLMTNMPAAEQAAALAKQTPTLGVGVHLVLTCGRPILSTHQTIQDVHGHFRELPFYQQAFTIDIEEVYAEWKAQIQSCFDLGLTPTHLDSHHHIHSFGRLFDVFIALAQEYRLPVRNVSPSSNQKIPSSLTTTDAFEYNIESALKNTFYFFTDSRTQSLEIMVHPAYADKYLFKNSSFVYPRLDELELLTSEPFANHLLSIKEMELSTFRDLY